MAPILELVYKHLIKIDKLTRNTGHKEHVELTMEYSMYCRFIYFRGLRTTIFMDI